MNLAETRVVHPTIRGQPYVATFVPAGADPLAYAHWRVVRQTGRLDNLRGGYLVRVDPEGRPLSCTCSDCYHRSDLEAGEVHVCKHCRAIMDLYVQESPEYQEQMRAALRRAGMEEGSAS
jgi:hypothetical protein